MSGPIQTYFHRDGVVGRDADSDALLMVSDNGNERVAVPSHFYKILVHQQSATILETLSILLRHNNEKLPSDAGEKKAFYKNNIVSRVGIVGIYKNFWMR